VGFQSIIYRFGLLKQKNVYNKSMEVEIMITKDKDLNKFILKKVLEDTKDASLQEKKISNEIKKHEKEMLERRKNFRFIRNK